MVKKHKSPSRKRYEETHPTISVRVSEELYVELEALRLNTGKSLGDILREALNKQGPPAENAYHRGYQAAKSTFAVIYPCSVCGEEITISSSQEKNSVVCNMKAKGWGHAKCVNKNHV